MVKKNNTVPPNRDAIRKATVGSQIKLKSRLFEHNDVVIEIYEPTLKQHEDARRASIIEGTEIDFMKMWILLIIECSYVPDTKEKVFDITDYDSFINQPPSGFYDEMAMIMLDLVAGSNLDKKKLISKQKLLANLNLK